MKRLLVLLAAGALVFGGVACSDDDPENAGQTTEDQNEGIYADDSPAATSQAGGDFDVNIVDFGYEPKELTVAAGEEVVWENTGEAPHTVTFKEGGIDSGNLESGEGFSQQFDAAGTTEYFCSVHGEERMSGMVVVQ
ncbi:MAG: plastocyanin/azurin family copper-binding protein [Actinomycetota bacterium]